MRLSKAQAARLLPGRLPVKVRDVRTPKLSESAFQQQVIDLAHRCGWAVASFAKVLVRRPNGSAYWETPARADGKGWFDLVLSRGPRVIFVELKVPGGRIEPEQELWHGRLRAAGQDVRVWFPAEWKAIEAALS